VIVSENFQTSEADKQLFSKLLAASGNVKRGVLMAAVVSKIDKGYIFVNLGLKSDGKILKEEFTIGQSIDNLPAVGETITVFLEALENEHGNVVVSYSKALREASWSKHEEFYRKRIPVAGTVVRKVNGGFIANLGGISAFLPKTQVPANMQDSKELFGKQHHFLIVKMDRIKSDIVVSLKNSTEVLESSMVFTEGQIVNGTVKALTESVAYVDLNGVNARLHIGEIAWHRIAEPSDVLKVGQAITAKVISIQNSRVNLSVRALQENPLITALKAANIQIGDVYDATVKLVDHNVCFVNLPGNLEGRLRASEMSWIRRYQSFYSLKKGDFIAVKVIDVDNVIHVSAKQTQPNPIDSFITQNKVGGAVQCEVVQISDIGYVVQIDQIDGIIPKHSTYVAGVLHVGSKLKAYIWSISAETGHVVLGMFRPPS
jgi:small subunit ribosomal protein S1